MQTDAHISKMLRGCGVALTCNPSACIVNLDGVLYTHRCLCGTEHKCGDVFSNVIGWLCEDCQVKAGVLW